MSCLRWLLTRLDFLMMECMLSLEILSMNVSSSPFLYFITVNNKNINVVRHLYKHSTTYQSGEELVPRSLRRLYSFMFTLISLTTCTALASCGLSWWLSGVAPSSSVSSRGYRITRCTGLIRNEPRLM